MERGEDAVTPKEQRFCDEYLIDCNATEAAKRAGYKGTTCSNASRWLDPSSTKKYKPELHKYIQDRLAEMQEKNIASAEEVMQYLTAVMRGEYTEEVLKLIGDGCQTITDIAVSAKERLKAAELIGKRYGLFKDKVGIEGDIPVVLKDDVSE